MPLLFTSSFGNYMIMKMNKIIISCDNLNDIVNGYINGKGCPLSGTCKFSSTYLLFLLSAG